MEEDNDRRGDVLKQLTRIERVVIRVTENSSRLAPERTGQLQDRGIDLITAVMNLFNAGLVYGATSFPCTFSAAVWIDHLVNMLTNRPKMYETAKSDLSVAIQEYDQAIWDLTLGMSYALVHH